MEIAQMITGNRPLPRLKTLQTEIFALFTRIACWLDAVLAPFESEPVLALAPALVPARISQTRTRRTTAARIYQRRRIATRIAFAVQELVRPSKEKKAAYPHKWAARVSQRRAPAAAVSRRIRFSANASSQPLTSAPSMAARHARGADAFSRAYGTENISGMHLARKIPTGGLHRAAFTPRHMSG